MFDGPESLRSSLPLLIGIIAALATANCAPTWYHRIVHGSPFEFAPFGHSLTFAFVVNDLFMVLFFGLAAKEVVVALRPGGSLNPPRRAANPIFASIGGVIAPAIVYLGLIHGLFRDAPNHEVLMGAWAVPTATDIALVWLVARVVFGASHPAVDFLLLLAIIDDLIGIGIIAIVYPEQTGFAVTGWILTVVGVLVAWLLRQGGSRSWLPYLLVATPIVWIGLLLTPVHASLALVPVVPLLPVGSAIPGARRDAMADFEGSVKPVVDLGLFFFGFANAGIQFGDVMFVTWAVLTALVVGKPAGIAICSLGAARWLGLRLPSGMRARDVWIVGFLSSIGLTIALFISGRAFPLDSPYQDAARMGAVFSLAIAVVAIGSQRLSRISRNRA